MKVCALIFKDKKMLAKILMCRCNADKCHQEQNEYVKKICHFHCHCNDEHEMFVYSCKANPLIPARTHGTDTCCTC